jgi:survival of motor neuron-related-splicing factor 30
MADLTSLEEDINNYKEQLESIESLLALDPQNEEYLALKQDITDAVQLTQDAINELRPAPQSPPPTADPTSPSEKPKWSVENHPAYQAGYRKPGEKVEAVVFKVGDNVLAKWASGDNGFYAARITSITGSSANPIYYVEFKKYKNTEALKYADLKPMHAGGGGDSRKRKADGTPVSVSSGSATPSGASAPAQSVISAAASINPAFKKASVEDRPEPSKVGDGPARPPKIPKKVKGQKELETNKSKWQAFSAKGSSKVAKSAKKESMFRTGDSVTSRGKLS